MNQIRTAGARRRHMQAKRSHKMGRWVRSVIDQKSVDDSRKEAEKALADLRKIELECYKKNMENSIEFMRSMVPQSFSQVSLDESLRREASEIRKKRMAVVAAISAEGPTEAHDQNLYEQAKTAVEAMRPGYANYETIEVVRVTYADPEISPLNPSNPREESKIKGLSVFTNLLIVLMAILGGLLALILKDMFTTLFLR